MAHPCLLVLLLPGSSTNPGVCATQSLLLAAGPTGNLLPQITVTFSCAQSQGRISVSLLYHWRGGWGHVLIIKEVHHILLQSVEVTKWGMATCNLMIAKDRANCNIKAYILDWTKNYILSIPGPRSGPSLLLQVQELDFNQFDQGDQAMED